MHHTLNASVPKHLYGFVCKEFMHALDPEMFGQFEPCVIIGVTSIPSRALQFSILCESGAQWARVPLHMVRHQLPAKDAPKHELPDLQCWDCHGWDFSTVEYEYLREMGCTYRTSAGSIIPASYWFTLDHTDNGFSQYPPEHKCYHFLLLEDGSGQIAAMPNNRILWRDDSFVKLGYQFDYKVVTPTTWHAEGGHRNPQETALTQDEGEPHVANWIKGAVKHPGAFKAKAKAAGMSTAKFAAKVTKPGSHASTTTKRQANLAKTLSKMR